MENIFQGLKRLGLLRVENDSWVETSWIFHVGVWTSMDGSRSVWGLRVAYLDCFAVV